MNVVNLNAPYVAQAIAAGYDHLQVLSATSEGGTYAALGAAMPLVAGVTLYPYVDFAGTDATWYQSEFINTGNGGVPAPAVQSEPQPGYLAALCNNVRGLLGVDSTTLPDATVQGRAFFHAALSHVRQRIATFDAILVGGAVDTARLAMAALDHYTAALLCPAMTVLIPDMLQFDKWRLQRNRQLDWSQTQQNLLAQYEVLVSQANGEFATTVAELAFILPQAVVMAGPTRGGIDTSGGLLPVVLPPDLSSGQPPYLNDQAPPEDFGTDG